MESKPILSQGLNFTKLLAALGLFLLIGIFTISTLCGTPLEVVGADTVGSTGVEFAQTETFRDSAPTFHNTQTVAVSDHVGASNGPGLNLRVLSFSLEGLTAPSQRFSSFTSATLAEGEPPFGSSSTAMEDNTLEDASLISLAVAVNGAAAILTPEFAPDVTRYELATNADMVSVTAETTVSGAQIIATTVGDETTGLDPASTRLFTSVAVAAGATTEISVTVLAQDGMTTQTYYVEVFRPGPMPYPETSNGSSTVV